MTVSVLTPPLPPAPPVPLDRDATRAITARDRALDVLKGIAIVGVLVIHANFSRFDLNTRATVVELSNWLSWCVPAFFFAAGRVSRHPTAPGRAAEYAWSRAKRLLIPFLAFTALYKLALLVTAAQGTGEWQWYWAGGPQLYFLPYLAAVTAVASAIMVAVRGRVGGLVIAIGLAVGLAALARPETPTHGPHLSLAGLYVANYLAGMARGREGGAAGVLLAGTMAAGWYAGNFQLIAAGVPPLLYSVLGLVATALAAGRLAWLGRWSGAIYAWHTPLLMPFASAVAVRLVGPGLEALAVTLTAGILVSVALGSATHRWPLFRPFRM